MKEPHKLIELLAQVPIKTGKGVPKELGGILTTEELQNLLSTILKAVEDSLRGKEQKVHIYDSDGPRYEIAITFKNVKLAIKKLKEE